MNERKAVTRLTLDLKLPAAQGSISCTLGDTNRRLEITVVDGGIPFSIPPTWTAVLSGTKSEGDPMYLSCVVSDGKVIFDFAGSPIISSTSDTFQMQVDLYNFAAELVASPKFYVAVLPAARNLKDIDKAENFSIIQDFVEQRNEINTTLDNHDERIKSNKVEIDANKTAISMHGKNLEYLNADTSHLMQLRSVADEIVIKLDDWPKSKPYELQTQITLTKNQAVLAFPTTEKSETVMSTEFVGAEVRESDGVYRVWITAENLPTDDIAIGYHVLTAVGKEKAVEGDDGEETVQAEVEPSVCLFGLKDRSAQQEHEERIRALEKQTHTITELSKMKSIMGVVVIKSEEWTDDENELGVTIKIPGIKKQTLTLLYPFDKNSRQNLKNMRVTISPLYDPDDEEDTVVLMKAQGTSPMGDITLRYIILTGVSESEDLTTPNVELIGAETESSGGTGNATTTSKVVVKKDYWVLDENEKVYKAKVPIYYYPVKKNLQHRLTPNNLLTAATTVELNVGVSCSVSETGDLHELIFVAEENPGIDMSFTAETLVRPLADKELTAYINASEQMVYSAIQLHNGDEGAHPYIQKLVSDFAKKIAADLAGYYKKDETLSKTEIGNLISAIPKFSFTVVDTLPASGLTTVVYLVPGETGTNNVYTENIYVNGRWERLGAQTLDLTGYVTEQLLTQRLGEYMTLRDVEVLLGSNLKYYYTSNEIDRLFIKLRDLPYSFPNPYPITINGVSYDGTEPVVLRLDELPIVESVEEMGDPENNENYYVLQETGQIWRARYLKGSDNWLPLAYTSPADHTPLGGVGYRFPLKVSGSTGEESEHSTTFLTGYIPIMPGDTVRFRNIVMNSATYGCIAPYYDASGAILRNQHAGYPESTGGNIILEDNGDYSIRIPTDSAHSTARFIRIQGYYKQGVTPEIGTGIITVNEEISEVETGWHWVDTGVKYTWGNDTALLDLEQRVTDAENEIDALKKYTEFPDEVPDYWREHLSEKIKEIQTAQKNANQRCVTWAAVSDLHESSAVNTTGVIIKAVCDACDINVVLGLGDLSTRSSKASEAEAVNTIGYAYNNLSPILDRLLPVRGNHDGGWGTGDKTLLKPSVVDGLMSYPMHTGLEITYDAVGSGYYVTDKARKVRYIMLNTNHRGADPDATVSADGSSSYPYMSFYRITQVQMEMIRDALTTIPNDSWSVVIASHIPPIGQIDRYGDGSYVIDISAHFGDFVALRDLINAYVDREAKTITYAGTAAWDKISLSVDFSAAKGHLVEFQSGHLHKYLYFSPLDVDPKTETVIGFPLRTVRCDGFQENHDDTNDSTLDDAYAAQRVKGTTSEHSFLVCVHNIDSRLTTCIHIGVQE